MIKKGMKFTAAAAAFALVLAGCGGSSGMAAASADYAAEATADEGGVYGTANFYDAADEVEYEEDAVEEAAGSKSVDEPAETEAADSDEKLVYTCSLRMQTLTYEETLANVRKEIEKAGGIIQTEDETNSDSYWYYDSQPRSGGKLTIYMTVRIPSARYKSFLASLEGEGKILSKNSSVENISRRYHDTEAVIRNLETQEARLEQMMEQAETVEDMITIEARLTEVQTQLDQNRTYLSSMDTDVAYSTVNLTIEEVVRYTEDPPKKETFLDRLQNAIEGSWDNFLGFLETVLFAVIYLAPIAAVVLVIVLIIRAILKAWRRKHPKQPKQPKAPKMPRGGRRSGGAAYPQRPAGPDGNAQVQVNPEPSAVYFGSTDPEAGRPEAETVSAYSTGSSSADMKSGTDQMASGEAEAGESSSIKS